MPTSLWIAEAAPVSAPASLPDQVDVAVIGGGIAGVCTALHLSRAGATVALLEAGKIASRASGRNDGQVLLGLGEHYNRIVSQFGVDGARTLWAFIRDNNSALRETLRDAAVPCDLREAGGLRLAETEHEWTELEEAAGLLDAEGIAHELIPAEKVGDLIPATGFHGGLILPGESVVQPAEMTRGLANMAAAAGALLVEDTPVRTIRETSEGRHLLDTDRGPLAADIVVHCTSALGGSLDPSGFLAAQLFPFRGQIIASDPLPAEIIEPFGHFAMSSNFCYEYFRTHGGRFVLGGMRWSVKGEEQGVTDDDTICAEVSQNLRNYVDIHFPTLRDVAFPHSWTGIMAGTMDGLPLLGALPGATGVFCNVGFNGYGLSFAFLAGQVLAEQILDGRAKHSAAALFAPRRFT